MNSIRDDYERLPYPHFVHPLTDPARLAALGRLLGVRDTADPATARVLDIGCGAASNLLAMAERWPAGRFVGIDFSAPDIAMAQALAIRAGLVNVALTQVDLMAWEPGDAQFDYIVAYGFFSWVPDVVRQRLLHVVAQCLAPQGIACISYMTFPGSKQPEALRDLMRLQTHGLPRPEDKVAAAHATLDFLDRAWQAAPSMPHAAGLRADAATMRRKAPHSLLLDDLGVERDPFYLLQFVTRAGAAGLRYVGDAELPTMLLENLPSRPAGELAAMKLSQVETEQMIDFVTNRTFRCSLVAHAHAQADVASHRDADAMRSLAFAPGLQALGKLAAGAAEGHFQTEARKRVTLRTVPLVAFVLVLARHPHDFTPYADLFAAAQELARRPFTANEERLLCEDLLNLLGREQLRVSACRFEAPAPPSMPCLTPLNRALASERGMLVTALHQAIRLDDGEVALCELLDGTRDLAELAATPPGRALESRLGTLLQTLARLGCLAVRAPDTPPRS